MRFFVMFLFMAFGLSSFAAETPVEAGAPTKKKIRYKKVTSLDFEDELIKGKLVRPDGDLLLHRNDLEDDNWLKLRDSFKKRVKQSARSLP